MGAKTLEDIRDWLETIRGAAEPLSKTWIIEIEVNHQDLEELDNLIATSNVAIEMAIHE